MKVFSTLLSALLLWISSAQSADHAVILLYHHVSNDTPPSTSVTPETFRQHIEYLSENGYHVVRLSHILDSLGEKKELPDKTVAITFDDAYTSVLDNAFPILEKKQWPFTVFVNTEAIDRGYQNYLSWADLRKLASAGVDISNHSHGHDHLVRQEENETPEQWAKRVKEDISFASRRLQEELGLEATMLAYPYGEYTPELKKITAQLGLYGIAQQSGAVGFDVDKLAVPRFPLATNYADIKRFATSVKSRPLPVIDDDQGPTVLQAGDTDKTILRFSLMPGEYQELALACYSSSGEKLPLTVQDVSPNKRISIVLPNWAAGRRKINCTAPSVKGGGEYYWYSWQWLVKNKAGEWYTE